MRRKGENQCGLDGGGASFAWANMNDCMGDSSCQKEKKKEKKEGSVHFSNFFCPKTRGQVQLVQKDPIIYGSSNPIIMFENVSGGWSPLPYYLKKLSSGFLFSFFPFPFSSRKEGARMLGKKPVVLFARVFALSWIVSLGKDSLLKNSPTLLFTKCTKILLHTCAIPPDLLSYSLLYRKPLLWDQIMVTIFVGV